MRKPWAWVIIVMVLCQLPILASRPPHKIDGADPAGIEGMHFPSWSPDGNWVAFSLYGDIWKVAAAGGQAQRLTIHEADDVKPRWSPDGKTIAFSSNRSGNFDIWTISAEGGNPTQVTFHSAWDSVSCWMPDSNWILFYSYRSGELNLWKIRKTGGLPVQITSDGGRDANMSPDGTRLVYCNGNASMWLKGYHGSANWEIFSVSLKENDIPQQLTRSTGNELYPCYSPDGQFVYYLHEEETAQQDGSKTPVYNLWRMDASGDNASQITSFTSDMITMDLSHDGKKIVFEKDFRLWQLDLDDGKAAVIPVIINSDTKSVQEITRVLAEGNEMGQWSPDSQQIAFALHGDIWVMPARGGEARQITSGQAKDQWPCFSPDGKKIAYFSNKSGNNDIYILELKTGEELQLTNHQSEDFFHSWSPDGKQIVFTSERSGNRDIWLLSSQGGIAQQLTDSPESEDDAVFSPDGKWILFDSGKGGNQEIWIMPADGTYKDARQLSQQGGLTQVPTCSPDEQWLAYETNDEEGNASIWIMPRNGGNAMKVMNQGSLPRWSPDGKWILFESERTGKKNIYRIEAPVEIKTGERIPFFAQVDVNLQEERARVFEEAWQAINQEFYDAKFHGVDWNNVKKKYQGLANQAQTNLEFDVLINRMVGELRSSHMGLDEMPSRPSKYETGYIGWELQEVPGTDKVLQVKEVLREGPADKAWIRSGDYVFQIAGKEMSANLSVAQLFNNQIGKDVKIFISSTLNPKDGRYVSVIPVNMMQIETLKYRHWLTERVQMVRQGCHGRVLYVHLTEMNATNLRKFREIVAETVERAEGMILDVRDNGGGLIHQELLDILMRRPFVAYQARGQQTRRLQPALYWDKPVVVLINEKSFSDAEVFAYAVKALKRGYLVGVPTAGGVIGTHDITLSNQAIFRVPRVGYYTLDGENMEGMGVKPDFAVAETPKDHAENRDPQLLKAIEVMMAQLDQGKASEPAKETEPGKPGKPEAPEENKPEEQQSSEGR